MENHFAAECAMDVRVERVSPQYLEKEKAFGQDEAAFSHSAIA